MLGDINLLPEKRITMINLETKWMGLKLKSPIVAGSSGLTNSIENIMELERHGAGAVVLKSLFEEQIRHKVRSTIEHDESAAFYPEAEDYIRAYTESNAESVYLDLIRNAKQATSIPIIASINCLTDSNTWVEYAKKVENAGADGLELNIFVLPSNIYKSGVENEKVYLEIVDKVVKSISIPVSIKISFYFSGLAEFVTKLSWTGIKNITMFNRFYSPDIDIEHFEVKSSFVFSTPSDIAISLRWIAMLSPHVKCDLAASNGIHDGEGVIKQLLAGATVVHIASALYKKGLREVAEMTDTLTDWMTRKKFNTIDEFRGKLSLKNYENPAIYERVQFMKYFSGIE